MRLLTCVLSLLITTAFIAAQDAPPAPVPVPKATAEDVSMKLGEFWYGMYTPEGKPEGYSRMNVTGSEAGVRVDWELHIAYDGGSYEEERSISHDAQNRLRYSRMKTGNTEIVGEVAAASYGSKEGPALKGYTLKEDKKEELSVPIKADATTGMGFVLAANVALKEGAELKRTEYNEADGFKEAGSWSLKVEGREELDLPAGKFNAWKVIVKRHRGQTPVWVSEDRRIVQVDWGTNNLMKLHTEPTKDLFKPHPPVFTETEPNSAKQHRLSGDFPGFTLDEMWQHWTTSEGIAKWWPQEAEIEPKVDGKFIMKWKDEAGEPKWTLEGRIKAIDEKKKLTFTWKWAQMPENPELEVTVEFKEIEGGVNLNITHGPYQDAEEKAASGHLEGWQYFGAKLKKLKAPKDG